MKKTTAAGILALTLAAVSLTPRGHRRSKRAGYPAGIRDI